jgi:hypothetical protein
MNLVVFCTKFLLPSPGKVTHVGLTEVSAQELIQADPELVTDDFQNINPGLRPFLFISTKKGALDLKFISKFFLGKPLQLAQILEILACIRL